MQFIHKMIVFKKWTAGTNRDSDLFHITYWEHSIQCDFENYFTQYSGTYKRELSLAFEAFIQNSDWKDGLIRNDKTWLCTQRASSCDPVRSHCNTHTHTPRWNHGFACCFCLTKLKLSCWLKYLKHNSNAILFSRAHTHTQYYSSVLISLMFWMVLQAEDELSNRPTLVTDLVHCIKKGKSVGRKNFQIN